MDDVIKFALVGIISPFFWWIVLGFALWLTRKFVPKWERVLFMPFSQLLLSLPTARRNPSQGRELSQTRD